MSVKTEIQTEVEALKARFGETKSLYREVCALLFFRYGITPTASKLYQHVRKGSMSAPAEALTKFWDELRSKARVDIDHPDLPAELRDTAAAAIAGIWQQASTVARSELAVLRLDVQAQLEAVRAEFTVAERQTMDLGLQLEAARGQLADAGAVARQMGDEFDAERRAHAGAIARLQELQRQLADQHVQQEATRTTFSADLTKAREAVEIANARADARERRALLEIDQERQARSRSDKQVEALRIQLTQMEGRWRDDGATAADAQKRLQARLETLEQVSLELRTVAERANAELQSAKTQLAASQAETLKHETEAKTLRDVLQRLTPDEVPTTQRSPRSRRG